MIDATKYTALTPFGAVTIDFPEDGGCTMDGDADAVAHLTSVIAQCTNEIGASIDAGNLEPRTLVGFCQPPGALVTIIEPVEPG